MIGWEDDSVQDYQILFFGAVWTLYDVLGNRLIPELTITNTQHPPAEYEQQQAMRFFPRRRHGDPRQYGLGAQDQSQCLWQRHGDRRFGLLPRI